MQNDPKNMKETAYICLLYGNDINLTTTQGKRVKQESLPVIETVSGTPEEAEQKFYSYVQSMNLGSAIPNITVKIAKIRFKVENNVPNIDIIETVRYLDRTEYAN